MIALKLLISLFVKFVFASNAFLTPHTVQNLEDSTT